MDVICWLEDDYHILILTAQIKISKNLNFITVVFILPFYNISILTIILMFFSIIAKMCTCGFQKFIQLGKFTNLSHEKHFHTFRRTENKY